MSENLNENIPVTPSEPTPEPIAEPVAEPVAEPTAAPAEAPTNANPLFTQTPTVPKFHYKSPMYVPSLVLGILSIIFALLIAIIGDILGIIGISLAVSRRWEYNVTAGMILSIVGLVLAILNHILAFIILAGG